MVERFRQGVGTVAGCCLALLIGCATSKPAETKHYQTIAADPNRDTATAKSLHEKALKILDRATGEENYQCTCIAKKLCDVHQAEQLLNDALVADVRFGPAHNTLGLVYYYQRRLYLAAWEFEFAADLMSNRAEPLNNLGMVYEEAKQIDQALDYYFMAMELEPNNPVCLGNLARAHLRSGKDLESVRGILHQLLIHDTRPQWIAWAEDLLGHRPLSNSGITLSIDDPATDDKPVSSERTDSAPLMPSNEAADQLPLPTQFPLGINRG